MTNREAISMLRRFQEPEPWGSPITEKAFEALEIAISALEQKERNRWRPVFDGDGEMPEVNEDGYSDYILVNFSNVPETFDIAQYRVNESGEGAFTVETTRIHTRRSAYS